MPRTVAKNDISKSTGAKTRKTLKTSTRVPKPAKVRMNNPNTAKPNKQPIKRMNIKKEVDVQKILPAIVAGGGRIIASNTAKKIASGAAKQAATQAVADKGMQAIQVNKSINIMIRKAVGTLIPEILKEMEKDGINIEKGFLDAAKKVVDSRASGTAAVTKPPTAPNLTPWKPTDAQVQSLKNRAGGGTTSGAAPSGTGPVNPPKIPGQATNPSQLTGLHSGTPTSGAGGAGGGGATNINPSVPLDPALGSNAVGGGGAAAAAPVAGGPLGLGALGGAGLGIGAGLLAGKLLKPKKSMQKSVKKSVDVEKFVWTAPWIAGAAGGAGALAGSMMNSKTKKTRKVNPKEDVDIKKKKTVSKGVLGTLGGAGLGGGVGSAIGGAGGRGTKGKVIGGIIGAGTGAVAGNAIQNRMNKNKEEVEKGIAGALAGGALGSGIGTKVAGVGGFIPGGVIGTGVGHVVEGQVMKPSKKSMQKSIKKGAIGTLGGGAVGSLIGGRMGGFPGFVGGGAAGSGIGHIAEEKISQKKTVNKGVVDTMAKIGAKTTAGMVKRIGPTATDAVKNTGKNIAVQTASDEAMKRLNKSQTIKKGKAGAVIGGLAGGAAGNYIAGKTGGGYYRGPVAGNKKEKLGGAVAGTLSGAALGSMAQDKFVGKRKKKKAIISEPAPANVPDDIATEDFEEDDMDKSVAKNLSKALGLTKAGAGYNLSHGENIMKPAGTSSVRPEAYSEEIEEKYDPMAETPADVQRKKRSGPVATWRMNESERGNYNKLEAEPEKIGFIQNVKATRQPTLGKSVNKAIDNAVENALKKSSTVNVQKKMSGKKKAALAALAAGGGYLLYDKYGRPTKNIGNAAGSGMGEGARETAGNLGRAAGGEIARKVGEHAYRVVRGAVGGIKGEYGSKGSSQEPSRPNVAHQEPEYAGSYEELAPKAHSKPQQQAAPSEPPIDRSKLIRPLYTPKVKATPPQKKVDYAATASSPTGPTFTSEVKSIQKSGVPMKKSVKKSFLTPDNSVLTSTQKKTVRDNKEYHEEINDVLTRKEPQMERSELDMAKSQASLSVEKAVFFLNGYEPMDDNSVKKSFHGQIPEIMKSAETRPPLTWWEKAIKKATTFSEDPVDYATNLWYGNINKAVAEPIDSKISPKKKGEDEQISDGTRCDTTDLAGKGKSETTETL